MVAEAERREKQGHSAARYDQAMLDACVESTASHQLGGLPCVDDSSLGALYVIDIPRDERHFNLVWVRSGISL